MRISSITITLRKNSVNVLDWIKSLFAEGIFTLPLT